MKLYSLAIATLCFVSTGLNIFIKAHNGSDSIYSEQSASLSTKLTQNSQNNPQSAEDYFNRGLLHFFCF